MRILGVDPGLTRCGVGLIDVGAGRRLDFVHVDVLRSPAKAPAPERIRAIADALSAVLDTYQPEVLALERVFARRDVSTVMGTAQISGVVMYLAQQRGIPVALHTPSEVKAAVTGYGGADKAQVGQMVARLLRLDAPPQPADAADALALAICHAWRGPGTLSGTATSGDGVETPAQKAWRAAEAASRGRGSGRSLKQ